MTEPSEAAKAKAQRMIADTPEGMLWSTTAEYALARFIQQVSDAAEDALSYTAGHKRRQEILAPFILPEPVDPLAEALRASVGNPEQFAAKLRGNLAKRGYKIVKDET